MFDKYQKRPVIVDAVKLDSTDAMIAVAKIIPGAKIYISLAGSVQTQSVIFPTLEGNMHASFGDWIIRGVKGEYYPCKDDIFQLTYEKPIIKNANQLELMPSGNKNNQATSQNPIKQGVEGPHRHL